MGKENSSPNLQYSCSHGFPAVFPMSQVGVFVQVEFQVKLGRENIIFLLSITVNRTYIFFSKPSDEFA